VLRPLGAAIAALVLVLGGVGTAWADSDGGDGGEDVGYSNGGKDPGRPGGDAPGGGSGGPSCEFSGQYNEICVGTSACWINDPAEVQEPKELEGVPRPNPDDHVVYISCIRPSGETWDRWYWSSQWESESILDRMWTARGLLRIPGFSARFNPPTRSIVNLQTWFAAPGMPTTEVVGSSAAGLVAIATPSGMTVDPGDGSAAFTCAIASTPDESCSHEYRRARRSGYDATVTVTYDLRYEQGGQVVDIPAGAPADLVRIRIADSVSVPVLEVQSVVTEVD